ncbi:FKBP-type peptidyl-prolyl cis-trans isomerase FkpA [Novosphingobium hassiacum]|uniref:Peptidyl-prolyl cis-trans isomerase n=2 Tax=Novosphingobium hassiacum TaxID=173676 RepID=A0A7W5ZX19_9SPHN|nr:FKBP-type peptidyl-prolyl cis-trans isomerase FkpA [Novosphingobium hassiacum]
MILTLPALRRIAPLALLALATAPATAATPPAPAGPTASMEAIALPLNPVISAGLRLCNAKTASGLGTLVLKAGEGAKPTKTDIVLVNYIGYLAASGVVFDQGMQAAFPVDGVIPGFSEGLQLMAKGATMRLCVPSALGYAEKVSGPIPANSDLVFQVTLADFKTAAEVEAMRAAQGADGAPAPAPQ